MDENRSGSLSEDELVKALGPSYLNIPATEDKVRKLFHHLDRNKDGGVSMDEFVTFIQLTESQPDFDIFEDGKQKRLLLLKNRFENEDTIPWTKKDEEDVESYLKEMNGEPETTPFSPIKSSSLLSRSVSTPSPFLPIPSPCSSPVVSSIKDGKDVSASVEEGFNEKEEEEEEDWLEPTKDEEDQRDFDAFTLTSLSSSFPVFRDIEDRNILTASMTGTRFTSQPLADWSSLGIDREGYRTIVRPSIVSSSCPSLSTPRSHYSSTSSTSFLPLIYEPNKEVSREGLGTADREASVRKSRREARRKRLDDHTSRIHRRLRCEELLKTMKSEKKARKMAARMSQFESTIMANMGQEVARQPIQGITRKKPHVQLTDLVFSGSKQSPFYHHWEEKENRDFHTTYQLNFDEEVNEP
jgi:hypothetical protein